MLDLDLFITCLAIVSDTEIIFEGFMFPQSLSVWQVELTWTVFGPKPNERVTRN
jgi:hypothetical protein